MGDLRQEEAEARDETDEPDEKEILPLKFFPVRDQANGVESKESAKVASDEQKCELPLGRALYVHRMESFMSIDYEVMNRVVPTKPHKKLRQKQLDK